MGLLGGLFVHVSVDIFSSIYVNVIWCQFVIFSETNNKKVTMLLFELLKCNVL